MAEQKTDAAEKPVVVRESTSHEFVRKIGPFGIIFFLALFVFFLYWCFFSKPIDLLKDYEAPISSEYYAQSEENLTELRTELETNFFPLLKGFVSDEVKNGVIVVTLKDEYFEKSRDKILEHYDENLFDFERSAE